jgi:LCP family protein required for cell wall assembly
MDNNNKIRKYVPTAETSVFDNSEFTDLSAELAKQKKEQKLSTESEEAFQYGFTKEAAKSQKKAKSSKKRFNHKKYRVIFGVIAALVGVLVGVVCFGVWYKNYLLSKITYQTTEPDAVITIVNERGETVPLHAVTQTTRYEYIQAEPVKNYLLIGIDSRSRYYNDSGTGERSDVICVLSIDKNNGTMKLVSIPRDAYALFPGYEHFYKINASMSWNGPDLLLETVESILRIEIEGYAYVNFARMADIVDAVGGVYCSVTPGEASDANISIEEVGSSDYIYDYGDSVWLDGTQAVAYARVRHVGNGVYERQERQTEVLRSILDQFMNLSASEKLQAIEVVLESIVTDIDQEEIEKMALEFLPSLTDPEIQYLQLPIDGCYNEGMYGDEWSMRINWNAIVPYVQEFFYGTTTDFDEVPIPRYAPDLDDCYTDIPLEDLVH